MLAAKENSHPGFRLPTAALHPGFGFVISNTATEFHASVYDFRGGPLSSGYFRDAETGLDYAKNRYHQPGMGRFLSPDPYMASGGPSNPGSWNRYAYVAGDPVNRTDRKGLYVDCIGDDCDESDLGDDGDDSGGGGGGGGGSQNFCPAGYYWDDNTTACESGGPSAAGDFNSSDITGYDADGNPIVGDPNETNSNNIVTVTGSLSLVGTIVNGVLSGATTVSGFVPLYGPLGGTWQLSYVPNNGWCVGAGVGAGIGHSVNVSSTGILGTGSLSNTSTIMSGWGGSATVQASPVLGYGVNYSGNNGAVGGWSVGAPGFGFSYGWSGCSY